MRCTAQSDWIGILYAPALQCITVSHAAFVVHRAADDPLTRRPDCTAVMRTFVTLPVYKGADLLTSHEEKWILKSSQTTADRLGLEKIFLLISTSEAHAIERYASSV